jgi:hypothetical protein
MDQAKSFDFVSRDTRHASARAGVVKPTTSMQLDRKNKAS